MVLITCSHSQDSTDSGIPMLGRLWLLTSDLRLGGLTRNLLSHPSCTHLMMLRERERVCCRPDQACKGECQGKEEGEGEGGAQHFNLEATSFTELIDWEM